MEEMGPRFANGIQRTGDQDQVLFSRLVQRLIESLGNFPELPVRFFVGRGLRFQEVERGGSLVPSSREEQEIRRGHGSFIMAGISLSAMIPRMTINRRRGYPVSRAFLRVSVAPGLWAPSRRMRVPGPKSSRRPGRAGFRQPPADVVFFDPVSGVDRPPRPPRPARRFASGGFPPIQGASRTGYAGARGNG